MEKNMASGEFEKQLNYYANCPIKHCPREPGRFCISYRNGASRLVYDPLPLPKGLLKYKEAYEITICIRDCIASLEEVFLLELRSYE